MEGMLPYSGLKWREIDSTIPVLMMIHAMETLIAMEMWMGGITHCSKQIQVEMHTINLVLCVRRGSGVIIDDTPP